MSEIAVTDFTGLADLIYYVIQPNHQAMIVEGPPGCGKTQMGFHLAREMQDAEPDFGSCYYNFAAAEAMTAYGVLKNSADMLTRTGVPAWAMPYPSESLRGVFKNIYDPEHNNLANLDSTTALAPYSMGISLFDEVKQAQDRSVSMALSQWWCEGRMGDWGVPTGGWARIGFTNNVAHRSGAKPYFMHERNRVVIVRVKPSVTDQCEVWRRMGTRNEIVLFARSHPDLCLSMTVPAQDAQFSTARSLTECDRAIRAWMENGLQLNPHDDPIPLDDKKIQLLIAGWVGEGVLEAFLTFMTDMVALPSYEEIVASPGDTPVPIDTSKLKRIADAMVYQADYGDILKLIEYAQRMPKTIAGIFAAGVGKRFGTALQRNRNFLDFMDWAGAGAKVQHIS